MLSEEQKQGFSSLKVEIIDLNILAHTFIRKFNRIGFLFRETTRHHIFEELIALRYMENGLILHLTNLDDERSKFSFRGASKEANKTCKDQKKLKVLNDKLKDYRQGLNKLKNEHRNKRIAHLNYMEEPNLDEFLSFEKQLYPLIKSANLIGDIIWGEIINYNFKLGSIEGVLNFRSLTNNLVVDLNSEKGF